MKNFKLILSLIVAVICISSCHNGDNNLGVEETFVMSSKMFKSTKFGIAKMTPVKNELNFYGKITADNNKLIEVFPVVDGDVIKVYVELGDFVEKGELLATIRSTKIAGFEKELDDAKTDLLVAQNNLKVAQDLFNDKLNTEKDVIEAQSDLDKAKSQLGRVQETFKVYNIKADAIYEVRSPLSGFIIQKNINEAMLLQSDQGDNIFEIAQIDDVWAVANVDESDVSQVRLGLDAEITTLSYPDKKFHGKIDKVYNIIDPETKAMKARVKLNNPDFMLKPEMRANIKLSYTEDRELLAIPSSAIVFDKSKNYVMLFKSTHDIETVQVEILRQVGDVTYILSGLKEGDKVLTTNQLLIYDALND